MKKEQDRALAKGKSSAATDNRVAQRHQKQSRAAQLSAANVEESPHMDRRDSDGGAGESLGAAPRSNETAQSPRRDPHDSQYGTKSFMKSTGGRPSSGGSGSSGGRDLPPQAPNPGSSETSSGVERDTMTGPRPGSGT